MTPLHITETLLANTIDEVAPMVADLTQWDLELEGLQATVLPRERGYEEILLARVEGAGIRIPDGPRGLLERLLEYVIESNVLAAYEWSKEELLVVRENVDDSNLDGLRIVIAHELVHRGQHVHHPEMFERVDRVMRETFEFVMRGGGFREALQRMAEIQDVMTLLESHAHYIQERLHEARFPDARVESHFNLASLLLRLFGARKIAQYHDGLPAVASAMASGEVEGLYANV